MGRRWLVPAALLWLGLALEGASTPVSAVDVQVTARSDAFIDTSRHAFDPDGPSGWKMTDRFHGFRFEIADVSVDSSPPAACVESIVSTAHERRCFGWIQTLYNDEKTEVRLVGEARCPKADAKAFTSLLHSCGHTQLLEYPNTKIRYHFPRFRVLDEPRYKGKTCFASAPHACNP